MSPVIVERITEDQARARRAEIIDLVGGNEENFRERAEDYLLNAHERALFDELVDLDYLLGL